jgi:hypothetical protein
MPALPTDGRRLKKEAFDDPSRQTANHSGFIGMTEAIAGCILIEGAELGT